MTALAAVEAEEYSQLALDVRAAQAGDREAFGALIERYETTVYSIALRRLRNHAEAQELTQEVFARAVAAPPRSPRPWLFAVALNLLREEGRKATRQGRRLELYKGEQESLTSTPDEDFEQGERVVQIRAALGTLNDRDREALLLQAEGFNYEEIAQTLGLAKGAIGTTLARARRRLVEAYRAKEGQRHVAS